MALKRAGINKEEDVFGETGFSIDGEILQMSGVKNASLRTWGVVEDSRSVD